jgi:hypothetical protein
MVAQGAAIGILGITDPDLLIIPIGIAIVKPRRLLFMEQWAVGTGGAHLLRWQSAEQRSNQVLFLVRGKLHFSIALFDEWWLEPDDLSIYQESFAGWKIELAQNRKHYMRFCRNEFRLLTR